MLGRNGSVGTATELWTGSSGDRIPVAAEFPALVHTGRGAQPSSCTMGTGVKPTWRGTHNPLPSSAEVKETEDLISLWVFMACSRVNWVPDLFPWGKQSGYGADHPPSSSAEVKEGIELYLPPHPCPGVNVNLYGCCMWVLMLK
jgi:hypothetical protein